MMEMRAILRTVLERVSLRAPSARSERVKVHHITLVPGARRARDRHGPARCAPFGDRPDPPPGARVRELSWPTALRAVRPLIALRW